MVIDVLTLFPEVFEPFVSTSIVGRARAAGVVDIVLTNIRDFATDRHRSVDDRPFGGGPGMVMMCEPLFKAVEHQEARLSSKTKKILLTPQGQRLNQRRVEELAREPALMMICGHYEGFDERIRIGLQVEEISIGDYVLSGGETAAMVLIDALVRLQEGALGDASSTRHDSFSLGTLEYPQYTRPREFRGMTVPEILLSGDHQRIDAWRREQAMRRTTERRPDLISNQTTPEAGVSL